MDYMMWAKAVLLCVRRLKRVVKDLDVTMDTLAVCSRGGTDDAQTLLEHAADLIARKTRIINLWVIAADMLDSLPEDGRRLLGLRFLSGIGAEALSRQCGIPLRTLYRRINTGLSACADYLKNEGLDNEYFEERYGDEQWIVSAFKRPFILRRPNSGESAPPRAVPARGGGAGA